MNWFEQGVLLARMRRVCAAGGLRCPGGRRMFQLRDNPLLRAGRTEWILQPGGCALTGAFGSEGFFAVPCAASPRDADALVRAIIDRQRAWGSGRVVGPLSPSIADFSCGAAPAGSGADASPFSERMPAFLGRTLEENGFSVVSRSILYELDTAGLDLGRYERAAAYAQRRFGVEIVSALAMGDRAACAAIARVSRTDPAMAHTDEETAVLIGALGRYWSRRMTQIALRGGEPVGCLLSLADGRARVARAATIQIVPAWRNRALTAALALPMLRAAAGMRVECGVIDGNNLASRLTVECAGARPAAVFLRYGIELI